VEYNPLFDCTSGTHNVDSQHFDISPNPASETATIRLDNPFLTHGILRLWDNTGRLILSEKISSGQVDMVVDLRTLASGLYVVEVLGAAGDRRVGKLSVEH
jgi:hypothetical protein